MMTEEERAQLLTSQFRYAQEPHMWHSTGGDLVVAAQAIVSNVTTKVAAYKTAEDRAVEECMRYGDKHVAIVDAEPPDFMPAFLLYGYALENFLKGLIVQKDPTSIGDKKLGIPTIHSLVALAVKAEVDLRPSEEDILERLTVITTWSGRYPVAREARKWAGVPLDRAAIFPDAARSATEIRALVDRVGLILSQYCPPRDRRHRLTVFEDETAPGLTAIQTSHTRR